MQEVALEWQLVCKQLQNGSLYVSVYAIVIRYKVSYFSMAFSYRKLLVCTIAKYLCYCYSSQTLVALVLDFNIGSSYTMVVLYVSVRAIVIRAKLWQLQYRILIQEVAIQWQFVCKCPCYCYQSQTLVALVQDFNIGSSYRMVVCM